MNLSGIVNKDVSGLFAAAPSEPGMNSIGVRMNGLGENGNDIIFADERFDGIDNQNVAEVPFEDAPIEEGGLGQWQKAGRTLKFIHNPVQYGGFAWITAKSDEVKNVVEQELQLYPSPVPSHVEKKWYRDMVQECYKIIKEYKLLSKQLVANSAEREEFFDRRSAEFLGKLLDAIHCAEENGAVESDSEAQDKLRALADAANVVGCFAVTVFLPKRTNMSGPLTNWVSQVDPGWTEETVEAIMETNPPTAHPDFWKYVRETCCRGLLDVSAECLRQATKHREELPVDVRECYEHAMDLLQSYPEIDMYNFKQWHQAVINASSRAEELEETELKQEFLRLFRILQGDVNTILQVTDNCIQAVGALVKFHDPTTRSRLLEYFEKAVAVHPIDTTVDWIVGATAVISGEILKAIQTLEILDSCVAATIAEICYERGLLDTYIDVASDARQPVVDWLVVSHAEKCLCDAELASTGLGLLELVGSERARSVVADALPRIRWESTSQIEDALDLARRLNLPDTEKRLNMAVATTCFANGRFLTGLVALERAGNTKAIAKWVWKLFEDSLVLLSVQGDAVTKSIVMSDFDDVIGDDSVSPLLREFLAPVAVLGQFLDHMEAGRGVAAANSVSALFQFPYLPRKYIGPLIATVGPLVSRRHPRVFASTDLVRIVDSLDRWETGDSAEVHEGLLLIESSLEAAQHRKELGRHDWRRGYNGPVSGDKVVKHVRSDLAHEFARAYLDGA